MPNPLLQALPDYAVIDEAFQDEFTVTNTPAGTSTVSFKTTGAFWDYYTSFFVFMATSLVAGNRFIRLQVTDQNNIVVGEAPAMATQPPNNFTNYTWTPAVATPYQVALSIGVQVIPLIDMYLVPGWSLSIIGQFMDVGDTFPQISATRVRFPTGTVRQPESVPPKPIFT